MAILDRYSVALVLLFVVLQCLVKPVPGQSKCEDTDVNCLASSVQTAKTQSSYDLDCLQSKNLSQELCDGDLGLCEDCKQKILVEVKDQVGTPNVSSSTKEQSEETKVPAKVEAVAIAPVNVTSQQETMTTAREVITTVVTSTVKTDELKRDPSHEADAVEIGLRSNVEKVAGDDTRVRAAVGKEKEQEGVEDGENTGAQDGANDGENTGAQEGVNDGENTGAQEGVNDGENTGAQEGAEDGENTGAQEGAGDTDVQGEAEMNESGITKDNMVSEGMEKMKEEEKPEDVATSSSPLTIVIIVLVVAVLALASGYWYVKKKKSSAENSETERRIVRNGEIESGTELKVMPVSNLSARIDMTPRPESDPLLNGTHTDNKLQTFKPPDMRC